MSKTSPYFLINGIPVGFFQPDSGQALTESWDEDRLEVTANLKCPWGYRSLVYRGLRGTVGINNDGKIVRQDPVSLPRFRGGLPIEDDPIVWERLICTSVGPTTGIDWHTDQDGTLTGLAGWGFYGDCWFPAKFEVTTWQTEGGTTRNPNGRNDISGMPYTTTRIRTAGEVFCPPSGTYKFADGTALDEAHLGIIHAKLEIEITRHRMPFCRLKEADQMIGAVNGKPMKFGNHEFPKGTLLYLGYDTNPVADAASGLPVHTETIRLVGNGTVLENIAIKKPVEWNMSLHPKTGKFELVKDKLDQSPFKYKNMHYFIWPEYYPDDAAGGE